MELVTFQFRKYCNYLRNEELFIMLNNTTALHLVAGSIFSYFLWDISYSIEDQLRKLGDN